MSTQTDTSLDRSAPLVVKIGGGAGIDSVAAAQLIVPIVRTGRPVVLVHGGSNETDELSTALGHPPRTITSPSGHTSRRSDARTIDCFMMAYCGRINKRVVEGLRAAGIDAVGLSGIDAGLWTGQRKTAIRSVEDGVTVVIRDDYSGTVTGVDGAFLHLLLGAGRTPVLCPPAVTEDGIAINVDADRAAAATAAALGASELLLLSNVPGVLRDHTDPSSLIRRVDDVDLIRDAAKGRMKNKVLAAEEALSGGVARVVIGSARSPDAIEAALAGVGTVFERLGRSAGASA